MDEILQAIQEALRRKGLSEAAASRLAVGNPSAIKNLRVRRGSSRSHPIETLMKVADVLGLELYLGPPRTEAAANGFSDGVARIEGAAPVSVRTVTIPYHEEAMAQAGPSPITLDRQWVEAQGLVPDRLSVIAVPEGQQVGDLGPGDLAVIQTDPAAPLDGETVAFFNGFLDGVRFGRLLQLSSGPVVCLSGPDDTLEQIELRRGFRVLGRVVASWRMSL